MERKLESYSGELVTQKLQVTQPLLLHVQLHHPAEHCDHCCHWEMERKRVMCGLEVLQLQQMMAMLQLLLLVSQPVHALLPSRRLLLALKRLQQQQQPNNVQQPLLPQQLGAYAAVSSLGPHDPTDKICKSWHLPSLG